MPSIPKILAKIMEVLLEKLSFTGGFDRYLQSTDLKQLNWFHSLDMASSHLKRISSQKLESEAGDQNY